MNFNRIALIPGNCLFPDHKRLNPDSDTLFFMAEDEGLCTHFRYHKHKLILFLSAMRSHAKSVIQPHYPISYHYLTKENRSLNYEEKLIKDIKKYSIKMLVTYEIEDHFFRDRIEQLCKKLQLSLKIVASPGFLNPISDFSEYLKGIKKPFMHTYYQRQRKKMDILMEGTNPVGNKWSFDTENRKKLPKGISIPDNLKHMATAETKEVACLVDQLFANHPGKIENFNWATTRRQALDVLHHFLAHRFQDFGPYEDAIHSDYTFIYHSTLSPYLNTGLITPEETIEAALSLHENTPIHFPSLEGFIRQIIGWREFLRGMYHTHNMQQNFFNHHRKLSHHWYDGSSGLEPVDCTIRRVNEHAYSHHIERLMVMGNMMLLCEIHPDEVYKWFMEMYIDSSDWVMEPNVYGMSQFAEGGIFATKPYISGSNYILKMSNFSRGKWCDIWNGLYWRFIDRNKDTFAKNQRMSMMVRTLEKMDKTKKDRLFEMAEKKIDEITLT